MTRADHVAWCKARALEYVDMGALDLALASLYSDLGKHDDTQGHEAIQRGGLLQIAGQLATVDEVRTFINGVS